ncbi:MAG: hypothetical protein PSX80_08475, partial [bacterium]|nr:hypothetical protein [bacterium]
MKKLYSFLADFLITLFSAVTLFASVLLVPASIPVFIDTGLPSLAEAGVVPAPGGRLQSKPSKTSMTTTFTMEDLGTLGITSEGSYVNDSGDVTGVNNYGGNPSVFRTFLYRNGQMTDIGTLPGATQSFPAGINSNGDLAGTSTGSISHAFLYRDGVMTDLGTFGGSTSAASGISDNGDVVGAARTTNDFAQIAFVYRNGVLNNLGTLGGRNSIAIAINSNGDVVGDAQIADGSQHAFLYRNGVMTDLGTLGGSSSQALAMNAAGDVVGRSYLAGDIIEHAFVYRNGQMT